MIVNPEKFQAFILDKQKHDYSNETIKFDNKAVETVPSVTFLGIQLDDKLNFNLYVSNIYKSEGKRLLLNGYFMSNFNYCSLVWMFSNATSLKKIENLQKRALRFLYNNW